jgi:tRNA threonylcarbamoyladenosine biosynthesis protein TsaB
MHRAIIRRLDNAACQKAFFLNLLAFDTSTEYLSLAVQSGAGPVLQHEGPGGANASGALIPALMQLLDRAGLAVTQLEAIVFGRGPGSFTGLRTACSVAQGLGFGSGVPVLGVDTLLAVAEEARVGQGAERVVAVLDARMDEVYFAACEYADGRWHPRGEVGLARPEQVAVPPGWAIAGNAFSAYAARLPVGAARIEALPTASALLRLAPALIAAGHARPAAFAAPLYVRDKVAQTTAERAARAASPLPS